MILIVLNACVIVGSLILTILFASKQKWRLVISWAFVTLGTIFVLAMNAVHLAH